MHSYCRLEIIGCRVQWVMSWLALGMEVVEDQNRHPNKETRDPTVTCGHMPSTGLPFQVALNSTFIASSIRMNVH